MSTHLIQGWILTTLIEHYSANNYELYKRISLNEKESKAEIKRRVQGESVVKEKE